MITKILLKIWPAITPILLYLFWVFFSTIIVAKVRKFAYNFVNKKNNNSKKKKKCVDGSYKVVSQDGKEADEFKSKISFSNKNFVISIYLGLILLILLMVFGGLFEERNLKQTNVEDLKKNIRFE